MLDDDDDDDEEEEVEEDEEEEELATSELVAAVETGAEAASAESLARTLFLILTAALYSAIRVTISMV